MTDPRAHHDTRPDARQRRALVTELIREFLEQRAAGTAPTPEELCRTYPHLQPELDASLQRLRIVNAARGPDMSASATRETVDWRMDDRPASQTILRCPFCHENALDLLASGNEPEVECPRCSQRFVRCSPTSDLPDQPALIGRFQLLSQLGMGGFGIVWKAHDLELERTVAVKVPRYVQFAAHEVEEFLREARIAAQLKHPSIVRIHEVGRNGNSPYIVSAFIDGQPLDKWASGPLPPNEAATLVKRIADGVQHAHENGVIHRDLKPANIVIDRQGEPHITDFGLAKRRARDITVSMDGRIMGTPSYMSPVQASGDSAATDARSDVYSLGVLLFELLTGELPFRGEMAMLIRQVIQDEPPSPRRFNARLHRDLETICLRCLEKNPLRRFATAGELAADLQRYLQKEPVLSRPVGRLGRFKRWCDRNRTVTALAAIACLLLGGLLAAGWWAYFDERNDRALLQSALAQEHQALEQENLLRQAFLQTGDFRAYRRAVETAAGNPDFLSVMRAFLADRDIRQLRSQLNDPRHVELSAPQQAFAEHPGRQPLQQWLQEFAAQADVPAFAWFVLDPQGLQAARSPRDAAMGHNYAWRTYFHGGVRDYHDLADYLARAPADQRRLTETYLSRALFTQVTHEYVIVISTPVESEHGFLGVLGMMVQLQPLP